MECSEQLIYTGQPIVSVETLMDIIENKFVSAITP